MDKQVSIFLPAVQDDEMEVRDVAIPPRTTVADVLRAAGLDGYWLRTEGGDFLSHSEDLYSRIQSGQKLQAILQIDVGEPHLQRGCHSPS